MRSPSVDGMAMDTGLFRVEMTGLSRLAGIIGSFSAGPQRTAVKSFRSKLICLPAVVIVGAGAWMLLSGSASNPAETAQREPVRLATAASTEPAPSSATDAAQQGSVNPPPTPGEAAPAETSPLEGLKISSQSWRRGGLGSKALITFTLRNSNDYAVKDIEIACAFSRRDGRHLTDRSRMIHDIVNTKSRKTFAGVHVGFVNINASKAKCSLVAASHI